jgi:hypothetical protein
MPGTPSCLPSCGHSTPLVPHLGRAGSKGCRPSPPPPPPLSPFHVRHEHHFTQPPPPCLLSTAGRQKWSRHHRWLPPSVSSHPQPLSPSAVDLPSFPVVLSCYRTSSPSSPATRTPHPPWNAVEPPPPPPRHWPASSVRTVSPHLARRHPGYPMVLAGKTLSPVSHRWAAGERATLRAASGDRTTPAERADRPKQLVGWANSAGTMGQSRPSTMPPFF